MRHRGGQVWCTAAAVFVAYACSHPNSISAVLRLRAAAAQRIAELVCCPVGRCACYRQWGCVGHQNQQTNHKATPPETGRTPTQHETCSNFQQRQRQGTRRHCTCNCRHPSDATPSDKLKRLGTHHFCSSGGYGKAPYRRP